MTDPLDRIAAALERIAPPASPQADPLAHPAYLWRRDGLVAARHFAPMALHLLSGIDDQKQVVRDNLARLSAGLPAHDMLLWGARGTGKSALVKSAVADVQASGGALALVEVPSAALDALPRLFDDLADVSRGFAVFIDDLAFDAPGEARALRSMLEGGAEARPGNLRLCVTSNRRHLMPRDLADQRPGGDGPVNPRDAIDDQLALTDRFGLSIGFHVVDQDGYLAIVDGYASAFGLTYEPLDAIRWATQRGARSGRIAWHYIVELAGRSGTLL